MSPKTLSSDHIMKIEWLIADKLAVGSPVGAESAVCLGYVDIFQQMCVTFVSRGAALWSDDTFSGP